MYQLDGFNIIMITSIEIIRLPLALLHSHMHVMWDHTLVIISCEISYDS